MRANEYKVLMEAIEVGARRGLRRAYKHEDKSPSEEELERVAVFVEDEICNEVCDWFYFGREINEP